MMGRYDAHNHPRKQYLTVAPLDPRIMQRWYVLHPGLVTSENDGQRHWVSAHELVRLYRLPGNRCYVYSRGAVYSDDAIHLHPRHSGDYAEHLAFMLGQPT